MAVRMEGEQTGSTTQEPQSNFVRSLITSTPFSVARESGSAYTSKLFENLSKVLLEKRPNIVKEVFVLNKEIEQDISFSCIVATAHVEGNIELGKSFLILLLASTGTVREETRNIDNDRIELSIYPASYLDPYLVEKVRNIVAAKSGGIDNLYNADGFVVPSEFDIENVPLIKELSKRCEQFLFSELSEKTNLEVIDLSQVVKDTNLIIDISTNNTPAVDSVGQPIRESFVIEFNAAARVTGGVQQSLHNVQGQKQNISRIGGFIDLLFGPKDPSIINKNQFMRPSNAPQETQRYIPRCVITSFDSGNITISKFLLSLYTTLALQEQRNWVQFFRRKIQTGKTPNYDDAGFLNIEANISGDPSGFGSPINTDKFDLSDLSNYMLVLVNDNLLYSLDCPDGSPETFYTRVFQMAADGNGSAIDHIYDTMDRLTGGYFSKEFDRNQPIVLPDTTRVLLGYWTDSDGIVRDIRDIDTITVCNMIGAKNGDPERIVDWLDLFIPGTYTDEELRLSKMKAMINFFLQDTATFTGVATRVNFNPEALVAMVRAIEKCGIAISNITTPINTSEMFAHRQAFNYDAHAFDQARNMFRHTSGMSSTTARSFRSYGSNPNRF